jgi:hypothetical protein
MASSSSHNNNGIPLATQLEWYKIRDTFFGDNCVSQNIRLALELVSSCQHPDARWLTEACAGEDVKTEEDVNRVFSSLGQNDPRAVCFLWVLGDGDMTMLRRSPELGFAQAWLAGCCKGEEQFKFAQLAVAQDERDGFFWLGRCFLEGEGCEMNLDLAKENFLRAANLGDVNGMLELGDLFDDSDRQRWQWLEKAARVGSSANFLCHFAKQVELFNSGAGNACVMFLIGRTLNGCVNEEARRIFKHTDDFGSLIGPAKQAITFYQAQIKATKDAVHAWTQVGIRFGVVKDVRKLIAKLIWDWRVEAPFQVACDSD